MYRIMGNSIHLNEKFVYFLCDTKFFKVQTAELHISFSVSLCTFSRALKADLNY